ncbi:MAG TPA: hypothetical protein VGF88_16715 [Acidobacteriaceae bacterium]
MPTHPRFEELCARADSGQLSAGEAEQMAAHLEDCAVCRRVLRENRRAADTVMPRVVRVASREAQVPAGMRERFLARAAAEGLSIPAGPMIATATPVNAARDEQDSRSSRERQAPASVFRSWRVPALVAGVAVCGFLLGAAVRVPWHRTPSPVASGKLAAVPPPAASAADPDLIRVHALTAERDRLAAQTTDLARQLEAVENEKRQTKAGLEQQLATAQTEAARDHNALAEQAATLSARAADLQSQLAAVREEQSLSETDLRNARAKTAEYSARLDLLQTQTRNQEAVPMASPDGVASLVAARNLHIIDVYDANAAGKRQRPFGRVFYVEGRSLVFYAYDLNLAHARKDITFHLWGEQAGSKETTLSLGVLHDDDPREQRWALTCNDPTVLAKINSVYVTAELPGRQSDAPRGPRVLYAYFGAAANHP